jgi:hypothetical protein
MVDPTASWGCSRQVQRGTINHINPISATRMRAVPTPTRNNPTSACMSHPVGINSLRSHSTVGKVLVDALGGEGRNWGIWYPNYFPLWWSTCLSLRLLSHHLPKPPRLDRPSVLPWTIASACRIADGSGAYLFHHAVKFALDLIEAAQDQQKTVAGGHDTHWMKRPRLPLLTGASS